MHKVNGASTSGYWYYHLNVHADVSSVTRPRCSKTFYSQLNCMGTIFIMLINVKMPTIMMNASLNSMKARKFFIFQHFCFYTQLQFYAQLS